MVIYLTYKERHKEFLYKHTGLIGICNTSCIRLERSINRAENRPRKTTLGQGRWQGCYPQLLSYYHPWKYSLIYLCCHTTRQTYQ